MLSKHVGQHQCVCNVNNGTAYMIQAITQNGMPTEGLCPSMGSHASQSEMRHEGEEREPKPSKRISYHKHPDNKIQYRSWQIAHCNKRAATWMRTKPRTLVWHSSTQSQFRSINVSCEEQYPSKMSIERKSSSDGMHKIWHPQLPTSFSVFTSACHIGPVYSEIKMK